MICSILSRCEVMDFEIILKSLTQSDFKINTCIDGGAGWGDTSEIMSRYLDSNGTIYAFEPFANNHKFFKDHDARINLFKMALMDYTGSCSFVVPNTVSSESKWSEKGLTGYSSLGHVADIQGKIKHFIKRILYFFNATSQIGKSQKYSVECTRIDDIVTQKDIDFIKLDLQGGEHKALLGMGDLISKCKIMWVEYTGDTKIVDLLKDTGFVLFDTNYMTFNMSNKKLNSIGLEPVSSQILSTGQKAVFAKRMLETSDYNSWFSNAKKNGVVQTDILAINKTFISDFIKIMPLLSS